MGSEVRVSYHRSGLALGPEHRIVPNRVGFVASLLSKIRYDPIQLSIRAVAYLADQAQRQVLSGS